MCVVNSDKANFEVIVLDKDDNCICSIKFTSITNVCRFLDDFNFDVGKCEVIRCRDLQPYNISDLLSIWRGLENESRI